MKVVKLSAERLKYGQVVLQSFARHYFLTDKDRFEVIRDVPEERYVLVRHMTERYVTFLFTGEYDVCPDTDTLPALYIHDLSYPHDAQAL